MVNQLVQRLTNADFKHLINFKKKLKVYIYPNLQGLLLGLFVFFCFLISQLPSLRYIPRSLFPVFVLLFED